MSGSLAIVLSAAPEFLARSRVLVRSLHRLHPEVPVLALAVAAVDPPVSSFAGATMVRLDELGIPNLPGFLFRYTRGVVAIATKPYLLAHGLDRGFPSALFLDADVWALDDLDDLFSRVRAHPFTLSPHLLRPAATAEEELRLLRSGTFNGGVVGVSDGPEARRFLAWWQTRVYADCRMAPEAGLHHDQRWLDLAPGFLAGFTIERDPGVNAAYWNLDERPIAQRDGRWFAGTAPLRLFHFSGFDLANPSRASIHTPRELPAVAARLFREYAVAVRAEELAAVPAATSDGEYLVSCFANGVGIPKLARSLYAAAPEPSAFGDPTRCGKDSFYQWLLEPIIAPGKKDGGIALPRIWLEILRGRPDVARAFPEPCGADYAGFVAWAHHHGQGEYGLDSTFLPGN